MHLLSAVQSARIPGWEGEEEGHICSKCEDFVLASQECLLSKLILQLE